MEVRYRATAFGLMLVCLSLTGCSNISRMSTDQHASLSSLEDQLKSALAGDEKQYGPQSEQVAGDLVKLGDLYRNEGKLADSQSALKRALGIRQMDSNGSPLLIAQCMNSEGLTLVAEGDFKDAETTLQNALSMRESNKAPLSAIAESQNSLGQLYYAGGVLPEAKQWLEKSFATIKDVSGTNSTDFAEVQNNLAGVYFAEGKLEQAEQMFQSSLDIYSNQLGSDHPEVADCANNLAEIYRAEGKYDQAESQYKAAIAIYQKLSSANDPRLAACLNNLALLYQKQKMYDKAEPLYKQALSAEEAADAAGKRDLSNTLSNYAQMLDASGRASEAKALEARISTAVASQQ